MFPGEVLRARGVIIMADCEELLPGWLRFVRGLVEKQLLGPMVTWEVVTKKLQLEQQAAEKNALVENAPINIILADTDLAIVSIRPDSASMRRTRWLERSEM